MSIASNAILNSNNQEYENILKLFFRNKFIFFCIISFLNKAISDVISTYLWSTDLNFLGATIDEPGKIGKFNTVLNLYELINCFFFHSSKASITIIIRRRVRFLKEDNLFSIIFFNFDV